MNRSLRATIFSTAIAAALTLANTAHAGLVGTNVTGAMLIQGNPPNYFDKANGFVPAGFLNSGPAGTPTVTIAEPAVEFGYLDGANGFSVNFTDNLLTIINNHNPTSGGLLPITFTFTDAAFAGLTPTEVSDNFLGGSTGVLSANTFTVNLAGYGTTGTSTFSASYSFAAAPVPEPGTALFGLALLGVTAIRRSRR
jgi:hypothetical protein